MIRPEWPARALAFIRQKPRPTLVGEVALHLGPVCSLEDAQEVLDQLESDRVVRKLTTSELRGRDLLLAYVAERAV